MSVYFAFWWLRVYHRAGAFCFAQLNFFACLSACLFANLCHPAPAKMVLMATSCSSMGDPLPWTPFFFFLKFGFPFGVHLTPCKMGTLKGRQTHMALNVHRSYLKGRGHASPPNRKHSSDACSQCGRPLGEGSLLSCL